MKELDNLVQAGRVHRTVYTDENIFSVEQQKVFSETWVYLAHASEIKEPNSFVARKMGQRSVIVTRDKENKIHALLNRCTHRGATVCREKKGDKTPFFTCPYHEIGRASCRGRVCSSGVAGTLMKTTTHT